MSLKAYNGLKTNEGLFYIQEKLKENFPKFKEASENKIAKSYANLILDLVDFNQSLKSKLYLLSESKKDELEINKIEKDEKTTLLSYLFQIARVLSKSDFANDFTAHLFINIEAKKERILCYPNILVEEHKKILDSFLDDWYAQNQTDPDESVPEEEWNERCEDWWKFGDNGFHITIKLFDPHSYSDNLLINLRGEKLIEKILNYIPSDTERFENISKYKFIDLKTAEYLKENNDKMGSYFSVIDLLQTEIGKKEFESFKEENPIKLKEINYEFLNKSILEFT